MAANPGATTGTGSATHTGTHATAPPPRPGGTTGPGSATHTTPHPVGTPAPKPPTPPKPVSTGLSAGQQSVYDLMASTLASWGLTSLGAALKNLILKGDTAPDTLALALSQTAEYKQRFAGNAERVKNGLSELNPAQYIAMEEQYTNVLQAYGLPKGFYDSHSDFTNFIGKGISAAELQTRAQVAHDQYEAAPQATKALWSQYFGSKGDAIAAILDPDVATQVIQDRGSQVAIGGAAAQSGFGINQKRAQQFQQAGVTLSGAQKAYSQIAQSIGTDQNIAHRFGTTFDQSQEENDLLLGQGDAAVKRATLYDEEKSLFKGGGGATSEGLGVSQSY